MRTALRFGAASQTEINQGYRDLIHLLVGLDRHTEIHVANSMWARTGFAPLPAFVDAARSYFDAEVRSLDFAAPGSVATINGWVSEKTRGRIPRLLESLAADEVLFLVNAIYFKGVWRLKFDKARTTPEGFHGADGVTRQVPMMRHGVQNIRFAEAPDLVAVDLLYGNGTFAMTVLLPRPPQTPAGLVRRLDPSAWTALTEQFAEREIGLSLPRFRLDYSRSLRDDLSALGMEIAFDDQRADLSGIADPSFGRLVLTRVIQKTFVEVNEEGTEAAAATGTGVGVVSAPPVVLVNRPFLFAIRERLTGTILFLGVVNVLGD
jgi:serpin B